MKRLVLLLVIVSCVFIGCTTTTHLRKEVIVEKDKDGRIVKTTIVEEIIQPYRQKEFLELKNMDK